MTSNDKIKALTAALNTMGFSQADKLTVYQIGELEQIMKNEYGIEIHIKDIYYNEKEKELWKFILKTTMSLKDYRLLQKNMSLHHVQH